MKTENALKICECVFVLTLAGLLGVSIYFGVRIGREMDAELTDLHRVTLDAGGAVAEIRASAKVAEEASVEEKTYLAALNTKMQAVMDNSADATADLATMIQRTDHNINDVLAPTLAQTVTQNDARLSRLVADTDSTVKSMATTSSQAATVLTSVMEMMAQVSKLLDDPANQQTIDNFAVITKNTAETTAHLDSASADIQQKVHAITRPASWARSVFNFVMSTAAQVGEIVRW